MQLQHAAQETTSAHQPPVDSFTVASTGVAGSAASSQDPEQGIDERTGSTKSSIEAIDVDKRMVEIRGILDHAAMRRLEKCELYAEYVRHAETALSVYEQVVHKPQGGRPEGGIARAARELSLPGKSDASRRMFIMRAIEINSLWPEVKAAVRKAGLDDNQSTLLAIARERTQEAQLSKVQELANKPRKQRCKKGANVYASTPATHRSSTDAPLTAEEKASLEVLKTSWNREGVLRRKPWSFATEAARRRFVWDALLQGGVS